MCGSRFASACWGSLILAQPSGVAGRNVHLFVHMYRTSCCKSLVALILFILGHALIQKMIHNRVEDANHEQPTSSKALFLVLLPDS